jgi:hypothetical protein
MTASDMPDANIRSPTYYVARTSTTCWHCGSPTRVLALAVPREHETLDPDSQPDTGEGSDPTPQVWQRADVRAFLFYVEQLSDGVKNRLQRLSEHFRPARGADTQSLYWANHCEHCSALLADHELHCEPDGAFLPSSEAAASEVHLLHIREPFEAAAGGIALEPEFFDFMHQS